jgi:hypothetical protein
VTLTFAVVPPLATTSRGWLSDVTAALELVSERRALRYAVLLAVSALSMPYGGLIHDSQLYAFQVMNRVRPGVFSSDLFLKYGSQDAYSPFSVLAAPVAQILGLDGAFFVLFLASSVLLVIGIERLVSSMIADPAYRMATAIFMLMCSMPYAGLRVFYLRESFLTPRTASTALALMALAGGVQGRHAVALLLALSATIMHPIMGVWAIIVVVTMAAYSTLPARAFYGAAVTSVAIAAVILGYRPAGAHVFGTMSNEWLTTVSRISPYTVIEGWNANDWRRLGFAFLIVGGAAWATFRESRRCSVVLITVAAAAAGGIIVSAVGTAYGYRLLIQAQPSRAVWLVQAVQIPAAVLLARHLWPRHSWGPAAALVVLGLTFVVDFAVHELVFPVLVGMAFVLGQQPFRRPRTPRNLAMATTVGIVGGAVAWSALKAAVLLQRTQDFLQIEDAFLHFRAVLDCVPKPIWLCIALLALTRLVRLSAQYRAAAVISMLAIIPHAAMFALHEWSTFQSKTDPIHDDVAFTRQFIDRRYPDAMSRPTVYAGAWPDIGRVWLGLDARNYLAVMVVIFREETARETRRRAAIVRSFELARWRTVPDLVPEVPSSMVEYLYAPEAPSSSPRLADLERVCRRDEDVDVVVLSQHLGNRASADNGRVFLYECERVRALAS